LREVLLVPHRDTAAIDNWGDLYKATIWYKNHVPPIELIGRACDASSTDHYSQTILETLRTSSGFWSSTGSDTTQANEHLTYQLCEPLCLVHKVSVKFYRANYQLGRPVYPAQQVRLSFGFDLSSSGALTTCVHTTPAYHAQFSDGWQHFVLPQYIPAHYVKVEFIGKRQRQPGDELYYTVVQQLHVMGTPLSSCQASPRLRPLIPACVESACQDPSFLTSLGHLSPEAPTPPRYPCATSQANPAGHYMFMPMTWSSEPVTRTLAQFPHGIERHRPKAVTRQFLETLGAHLASLDASPDPQFCRGVSDMFDSDDDSDDGY
jgi:hypothetical protein